MPPKAGLPLYTPEKLEEHLPAALSAFGSAKPPCLTAVVPPNFPLGMDKEFMLTSFHLRACLRRTSLTISGKWRQVAFCPYCGVTNDNAEKGLKPRPEAFGRDACVWGLPHQECPAWGRHSRSI